MIQAADGDLHLDQSVSHLLPAQPFGRRGSTTATDGLSAGPIGGHLKLEAFQPEVLFGYPSAILPMAQTAVDGLLHIRPDRLITGGERISWMLCAAVRQAWQYPVLDLYATTKTGALCVESPDDQCHYLFEDTTLVEAVDENERLTRDGEPGHHLRITCLNRITEPFIRYPLSIGSHLINHSKLDLHHSGACVQSRVA